MSMKQTILPLLALATSVLCGCAAETSDPPDRDQGFGLEVRIGALDRGSGRIEYSLANHGSTPVRVLSWKTGLREGPDPLFDVYRAGARVEYRGPIVRRVSPKPTHYIEIAPEQRLSAEVDLRQVYDLRAGGTYAVHLKPLQASAMIDGAAIEVDMGPPIELDVAAAVDTDVAVQVEALSFSSQCTASQRSVVEQAQSEAVEYAYEANEYYDSIGHDDRAVRWFGPANDKDKAYVDGGLNWIFDRLWANDLRYNCGSAASGLGSPCRSGGALAWVNPWAWGPKTINLCDLFWDDAQFGGSPDASRSVTIIHEIAHFYLYLNDHECGFYAPGALWLAQNDPKYAKSNAENYALYTIDGQIPADTEAYPNGPNCD